MAYERDLAIWRRSSFVSGYQILSSVPFDSLNYRLAVRRSLTLYFSRVR